MNDTFSRCSRTVAMAVLGLAVASCSQVDSPDLIQPNSIIATVASPAQTRTAVDGDPVDNVLGILWTDGDQLGVFDADGKNHTRYDKTTQGSVAKAVFSPALSNSSTPVYAYYPYSSQNDGKDASSLVGEIPASQDMSDSNIPGDYKYGTASEGTGTSGYDFQFRHLFSLIRVQVSAEGTLFADDTLKEINYSASRNGNPVSLAGTFSFNATNGSWAETGSNASAVKLTWGNGKAFTEMVNAHTSVFPNVRQGDDLTFTITTGKGYTAQFTAKSKVNFTREGLYLFPFNLVAIAQTEGYGLTVKDKDGKDVTSEFITSGSTNPEEITGTFTCACFNVDGLPDINYVFGSTNADGPGADGTTHLGQVANEIGWDFFGVSEDFEYDSQLTTALSNYNHGTWRGSVSEAQLSSTADTDGLNFFWKKQGITASNEKYIEFTDKYGGLKDGANDCIKKGFRHYEVTVAEGVVIDVYITHMNTYSGSGNTESNAWVKAVLSQLRQARDEIIKNAKANKRPAIFMGDTNMRYTRHNIKANLIDVLNGEELTFNDPWVDFHRNGVFPEWNTRSLMIRSMFKGDKVNDICCSDEQRGEVVDKIWYFNVPGAPLQLTCIDQYNDVDRFVKSTEEASYSGIWTEDASGNITQNTSVSYTKKKGWADHFPVVCKFKYTLKK